MAIKLSWHAARCCWKKQRKGRTFYLAKGRCKSKSDREGLRIAQAEWREIERELDSEDDRPPEPTDPVATLEHLAKTVPGINVQSLMAAFVNQVVATPKATPEPDGHATNTNLADAIERFLAEKRTECLVGNRSAGNTNEFRVKLHAFLGACVAAGVTDVQNVNADLLSRYRNAQLALLNTDNPNHLSPHTIKRRLGYVASFLHWCYENEILDRLPRNLTRYSRVPIPKPTPEFFTIEEVRTLYQNADPILRAYILLAANCAYTQSDIASLQWEHINVGSRILTKYRTKTETTTANQVQSSYRLWPITLSTLQEVSTSKSGLILVSKHGTALYRSRLSADNGAVNYDLVGRRFKTLRKKLGGEYTSKPFKLLRKTSANLIAERYQDKPHIRDLFLGHAIAGMSAHYTLQFFDTVHEACDMLERVYQLS